MYIGYIKSSKIMSIQYLAGVTPSDATEFLHELANLSDDAAAVERFYNRRFARLLPWAGLPTTTIDVIDFDESSPSSDTLTVNLLNDPLFPLRDALRDIWTEPDPQTKQWRAFLLGAESSMTGDFLRAQKPPKAFHQIILFLLEWAKKTRKCQNPECPAPYFLGRSSQKFCCEECAKPAKRRYKSEWWHRSGKAWRKRRAKSAKHRMRR
jgi:hypothetical protein